MRTTYRLCKYCGDLHQLDRWPHNCRDEEFDLRSDLPAPYVVTDNLPGGIHGMRSMSDGKMYDSKSAYYASLKRSGHEIVGNDRSMRPETLREKVIERGPSEAEITQAVLDARDQCKALSDTEMQNMVRAICPAEPVIPNG